MRLRTVAAGLGLAAALAACTAPPPPRSELGTAAAGSGMSTCKRPQPPLKAETPTTIDVVEEAYYCILAHYYAGPTLDAHALLTAGFIAMTHELNRNGRDSAAATVPAYKGDRWADWKEFEAVYRKATDGLPEQLRTKLAVATLEGIVAALDNNHARWAHDAPARPLDFYSGDQYGLGFRINIENPRSPAALPPVFVTAVLGGPAEEAGLKPGDIIETVDGSAAFIGDQITSAAVAALFPESPDTTPVRLRVLRESAGRRWSVTLKPRLYQPDLAKLQGVKSARLRDGIAYVSVAGFAPQVSTRIFRAISRMAAKGELTGLVLDLRGNGGGSPDEANLLASAFAHGKVTAYMCTVDGECRARKTDDGVPLLDLPLVVLTDRGCASACEHFSSAVKDLKLGTLVGTRTAGAIAGPAGPWLLTGNNTVLSFPSVRHLAPNREVIDKVGVAPDHHLPLTAEDVAAGRDSALDKALSLLGRTS